ncbi:MAG TPA: hypothetical protein VLE69_03880 [Candidatus Saccharimonadales bacterium]|nr:hypothetical protein [Candidatus Saccharimonadales bacterium]
MAPVVLLGIIAAVPLLLILILRSNAAVVFFSLCAGSVLVTFVGSDASEAVGKSISGANTGSFVKIALLLLPALLSLWFLRKSISPSKLLINIVAAVGASVSMVLLLVPLLPGGVLFNIEQNQIWQQTNRYQGAILGATTAVAIVSLWLTNRHKDDSKHKKHH